MRKKKYAMVGINSRQNEQGEEVVRRVLIEYNKYQNYIFYGTRFIEKDPYFYDKTKSHQYKFKDDGYIQLKPVYSQWYRKKRAYHYNVLYSIVYHIKQDLSPILFKAKSDEEAILVFNNRKELR